MSYRYVLASFLIFLLLVLGFFWTYKNIYPQIISPEQKNEITKNLDETKNGIIFESSNGYFIANTDNSIDRLSSPIVTKIDFTNESTTSENKNIFAEEEMIKDQKVNNIYKYDENNNKKAITNISYPQTVSSFQVSADEKFIVFSILNSVSSESNIYICEIDGTNTLQLTNNGISFYPLFSPDSNKIAFYQKGQGIFITNFNKTSFIKILNYQNEINNIIIWR